MQEHNSCTYVRFQWTWRSLWTMFAEVTIQSGKNYTHINN